MTVVTEGVSVFFSSLVALMMGVPLVLGLVALFCLHLRAGDLGAGGARDRDPARAGLHPLAAVRAARSSCSGDGSAPSWSTRSTGVVAGAILRVFMGVGMGYVTTYTGALMGTGSSDPAELGLWVVVLLPLVVSGLMAGMKVGELAAMLVSGSGSVGSGMMALVVHGGGRLSAAANPARPPVPGG